MHGFFPGAFLFGPALLFFGLFKILLFVLLIMLIVRFVSHGRGHHGYGYGHPGHGYGYGHGHGFGPASAVGGPDSDPRRVAALRYAAGKIDRAEFDRIMSGLDAATPSTPPATPAPPTAPTA